jgi:NodT family efflux transporter outer membrane factor (OMF) lipoprotein
MLGILAQSLCGCTPLDVYVRNHFKVGPNYRRPPAPVAEHWIDAADVRVRSENADISRWWGVFNDPALDSLIQTAYQQNLTLREAGFRVLEARAQLGITVGNLFPQVQQAKGEFVQQGVSFKDANRVLTPERLFPTPERFFPQWSYGFSLAWELDFWGRFRRAVESADDSLNASVENYDDVLVTLLGDVASTYVQMRTLQQQLVYVRANVQLQRETLAIAQAKFRGGQASELDVDQAQSTLYQTEAQIPQLEIQIRQANDQLCVLLGIPSEDLVPKLGDAAIPITPPEVFVGVPADLLRRRPDVRRQERLAAAQCAQIGIADADFYPAITLNGAIGYSAKFFPDLFNAQALQGSVGPSFQWNLLNYGRILNNVRLQAAKFQEMVVNYQNTVLQADAEVENGLVQFLKSQQAAKSLAESVAASERAVKVALSQYKGGLIDFNRVSLLEQNLVQQQTQLAQARGAIATGLIQVYRALGGGWQIRCTPTGMVPADAPPPPVQAPGAADGAPSPPEPVPGPKT